MTTHRFKRIIDFGCHFLRLHHGLPPRSERRFLACFGPERRQFLHRMAQKISFLPRLLDAGAMLFERLSGRLQICMSSRKSRQFTLRPGK